MSTIRNAQDTRSKILDATFHEMHHHGYQGFRIDAILKATALQKGALYHHFPSKQALGMAVLEELIQERIRDLWIKPLTEHKDPVAGILSMYKNAAKSLEDSFFIDGCPLNNLSQEMSALDEKFRKSIETFYASWRDAIAESLTHGQQQGFIKKDIDLQHAAFFIITIIQGCFSHAKIAQSREAFEACSDELARYLFTLYNK
jgi:TetR/AcrR family transcriptional regulator, transcriptional repressor for nem operon